MPISLLIFAHHNEQEAIANSSQIGILQPDEKLEITFSSRGCFHDIEALFIFTDSKVTIFEFYKNWSEEEKKYLPKTKKELGVIQLSERDRRRLNRLFLFYASDPGQGCTTIDSIKEDFYRKDRLIKSRTYTDGSCATYSMDNLLTLPKLKARLQLVE